jgi:hypothetical protein
LYSAEYVAELRAAEKELGDAYLRLRQILGAFRTPHAPTSEQVWAHTENRARELQAQVYRLRENLERVISATEPWCRSEIEGVLRDETPAQSVAHIEVAVLRRFAATVRDGALPGETWAQSLAIEADRIEHGAKQL